MKRDILYVDDELDNLLVFEAAFDEHFHVVTANSGPEALELLAKQAFPVVVSDERMPGMGGAELFRIMRHRHPNSKRIILTGYADSTAMLNAINQGQVYYFIKKPWEHDMLFSVLTRAIEAHDLAVANTALTDRLVESDRCATLGRLAAQVAHEMGNQLCLLPLLELIEDNYRQHEDLVMAASFARQTHDRLLELINEIKDFVRFEHKDKEVSKQKVSLAELIYELVDFLRYDASLSMDCLHVEVQAEPIILANKIKLQQVLVNLLKNAQYAIRGREQGQLWLRVAADADGATISVRDNGCGMDPQTAARIWEPFFTTKGREGNGLGLDIAKTIVEGHGGTIDCQTQLGEGTTFTMRLPICAMQRAAGPAATAVGGAALDTPVSTSATLLTQV